MVLVIQDGQLMEFLQQLNAHPHSSKNVSIVHNGIIENYTFLKNKLTKLGYIFYSETDSEVIAHLLDYELKKDEA